MVQAGINRDVSNPRVGVANKLTDNSGANARPAPSSEYMGVKFFESINPKICRMVWKVSHGRLSGATRLAADDV
jgi:hypothetical protein